MKTITANEQVNNSLINLRLDFAKRIPQKVAEIEALFYQFKEKIDDHYCKEELLRHVHGFVGASGCYGFLPLSRKAYELELFLLNEGSGANKDKDAFLDRIWCFIFALKSSLRQISVTGVDATATAHADIGRDLEPLLATPLRILVATDDNDTSEFLRVHLIEGGHEILSANNGKEAVEQYQQHNPDIILMDVMMPVMDGLQAASAIKSMPAYHFTPLIFMTCLNSTTNLSNCIRAGGDEVIVKPFDPHVLTLRIYALHRIAHSPNIETNLAS